MYQSKLQASTITVSRNQEKFAKKLLSFKEESVNEKGNLACRWVQDERSKLCCQWFIEEENS